MATFTNIHNTSDYFNLVQAMPDITSAVTNAGNGIQSNLLAVSNMLSGYQFNPARLTINSSSELKYEDSLGTLDVVGVNLPVYVNGDWTNAHPKITSIKYSDPAHGGLFTEIAGAISISETASKISLTQVKFGSQSLIISLKGNLAIN